MDFLQVVKREDKAQSVAKFFVWFFNMNQGLKTNQQQVLCFSHCASGICIVFFTVKDMSMKT